jgi:naphthoate synthase
MGYTDILFEKKDGVAKVTINRPDKMNAFTYHTWNEMQDALIDAMHDKDVGVVVLTGAGDRAFCTGGDVSARTDKGYGGHPPIPGPNHLLRTMPKVTIAMVNGYAIGGGHVLHMICDLTIASETAQFGQVGPKYGSFDAGFGSAYMARLIGQKRAREMWFLCRRYTAQEAKEMGLVNWVVPPDKLEEETMKIAQEILALSPTAIKALKASFNADVEHINGIEEMAAISLRQYYSGEESKEGSLAFLEKRSPDYSKWR